MQKALFILSVVLAVALAEVVELTPNDFDSVVGGSKAVMVKFYTPWCGHCKKLAPEYEIVAENFASSKKVVIAGVDCDENKDLCQRFDVRGYPTVNFFPKGSQTPKKYEGARTAEEITTWIENEGIKSVAKINHVVSLDPTSFSSVVLDESKSAFVKFFAPWCGHCKKLAPDYETVASIYANEDDLIITEVDCDEEKNKELCSQYGITGFPTLKFFPKSDKSGVAYTGGRSIEDFVTFFNTELDLQRTVDGGLTEMAGRIDVLDTISTKFLASGDKDSLIEEASTIAETLEQSKLRSSKVYLKVMGAIVEKGSEFVGTEIARLERMISSGSVNEKKIDDFKMRINILHSFL